jgi:hypothetical protein
MGKKGKGKADDGGGEGKEKPLNEKEQFLANEVQALNEQLSRAEHDRERYKVGYDELTAKLKKQEADRQDQAEYLKHELEKTRQEVAALEEKYLALETSKESMERRLNAQLAEAQEKIRTREGELRDASTENERLTGLLTELGQLRTNAAQDSTLKDQLSSELADFKYRLGENSKQLEVLRLGEGTETGGEDGSRVVPLMLLEAIRLHVAKPVLVEQAMVGLQYVLSSDRHADAELIRRRGGPQIVLECMEKHPAAADLQSAACGLLWKLAFADLPVREVITERNGVALIMGALQKHATHPRLSYNACGALRHLLVTSPVKLSDASSIPGTRADTALPPIAGGGRRGGGTSGARRVGRGGMSHVPIGAPPRMLLASGGGSSSRSGLRGVNSNPDLQTPHAPPGRLAPLDGTGGGRSGTPGTRPSTVAISTSRRAENDADVRPAAKEDVATQALKLTVKSMVTHASTPLVQEYGCGTLFNLVLANPTMRKRVCEEGGVPIVLHVMRTHPDKTGCVLHACALIKELAEYSPALQQLEQGGARPLLLDAMTRHQMNEELLLRANEALRFLPDYSGGADE